MDPMMIEVTVTPQISPVATKARPTEGVGTSADVMPIAESTLKEPLSLDPPSSEALIEKASDVAGASTATIPESTLVVPEIRLPSSGELSHAEGSSIELVPSSSLSDRIRALLADEDPDKAGICSDLDGFISFLNSMVDRILSKGSRFESFKKPLDLMVKEMSTNIATRRRRISDSEEEIAPRQATEPPREAVMSPRGKEAAESSRKGKEPALPVDSEEEFDSEATETSEGEDENESSSEEVSGLPDSFFDRGLVRPSVAPTQPQAAPKKRKERVVMEHPNRMTVEVLSCDEEDEEDMVLVHAL
ncbi:uncharacterized protein LOC109831226 [Asparagus officinalis]|uniref:uncharacterized protein LOC109831226 n=2 Tax=Asparagus officinalis TaxID=4686 RepID=UPI00098E3CEB|nr:uncharacterized protein LOC109831226 [Asparagus officinalis]